MNTDDFFCSWSGGKDSCLALFYAMEEGGRPKQLLTMFNKDGDRSRSHGTRARLVRAQADSLGVPSTIASASWDEYEDVFVQKLRRFHGMGISAGVFGDIDLQEHRDWCVKVCDAAGLKAHHPLWQQGRISVVEEFIDLGFEAIVVCVSNEYLSQNYLGRTLDRQLIQRIQARHVDPCGERGELHTLVVDGPVFDRPLNVSLGQIRGDEYHSFIEVDLQ